MNRSMWKTTLREIRASLGRYLAIFAIIALGVGFFSGLKVTGRAMVKVTDDYLKEHSFYDYRLISTLGLEEADAEALRRMTGVRAASGAYHADAVVTDGSAEVAVSFHSITPGINTPSLTAGRMPVSSGEAVADARFCSESMIGTTIRLADSNTDDNLENFARRDFTIVGLAYSPLYLNYERGTTSVGNGSVSYFCLILPEDFDFEVYTDIYVKMDSDPYIYSDDYKSFKDENKPGMEDALTERAMIRYNRLYSDADGELTDARRELADAEQKLADAHKEIEDGKQEIADGEQELADARAEIAENEAKLADAEKEIAENEQKLIDAEKEIADNEKLLSDGEKELADGKKKLSEAAKQIADNEAALSAAADELNEKEQLIEAGEKELDANEKQLNEAFSQLQGQEQELLAAKEAIMAMGLPEEMAMAQLSEQFTALEAAKATLEANRTALEEARAELVSGRAALEAGRAEYEAGLEAFNTGKAEYEKNLAAYESSKDEIANGRRELEDAKLKVADGWAELNDGKTELEDGRQKLADAKTEVADGDAELEDARKKLADGEAELADKEQEFYDAKAEFEDAEQQLADFKEPTTYVLTRDENIGYACFENDSKIVDGIAVVFPVFFFLVAALVCVTTMSRMIEEQRTQIGVLKALGYSSGTIMAKYLIYSGSAALFGGVGGFFLGCYAFPTIIWKVYGLMYGFTPIRFLFDPVLFTVSIAVALICSAGTTFISCRYDLSRVAAELIRPKSPKSGKRILLERIGFIWKRIKFLHKVSIRNIFRYKGRFVMMLLGIGGCTGLLLTGYGIRDSITEIADEQYTRIQVYDEMVNFSEALTYDEIDDFKNEFAGSLSEFMPILQFSADPVGTGSIRSLNMVVLESDRNWTELLKLHDKKTGEQLPFPAPGEVIITHNAAKINNLTVGSMITFRDSDFNEYTLKVSGICDNYFNSYAYISADTYLSFRPSEPPHSIFRSAAVNIKDGTDLHEAAAAFMNHDKVASVNVNADTLDMFSKMMKTMNYIVVLVIFCAAALAFIVLYNLTNINITERIREIATIKVLGFYPNETAAYVFRENLALTALGAAVGIPIGIWLHQYVMSNIKIDMVTFDVHINPPSYLYAILYTFAFALLVDFVMFFKLKRINMAESLKSIE
ncbi:MAG: FtsX-like permease family protein [Lachnospiraceae bacterium]|nr:FtsX-like permease family protein [Lachnospiraceae bacterium]